QSERAEFIRLQCRLATLTAEDAGRPALQGREKELLRENQDAWTAPVLPLLGKPDGKPPWWAFRRGFVESVKVQADAFVEHAEHLFRLAPLRRVELHGKASDPDRLFACPLLCRLAALCAGRKALHGGQ